MLWRGPLNTERCELIQWSCKYSPVTSYHNRPLYQFRIVRHDADQLFIVEMLSRDVFPVRWFVSP